MISRQSLIFGMGAGYATDRMLYYITSNMLTGWLDVRNKSLNIKASMERNDKEKA